MNWISVKDKMPGGNFDCMTLSAFNESHLFSEKVLMTTGKGWIGIGVNRKGTNVWFDGSVDYDPECDDYNWHVDITHWMPLPKMPNKEVSVLQDAIDETNKRLSELEEKSLIEANDATFIEKTAVEYIDNYIGMGLFKNPQKVRPYLIDGFMQGWQDAVNYVTLKVL